MVKAEHTRSTPAREDGHASGMRLDLDKQRPNSGERIKIAYLGSSPGGEFHFEKWLMWRGIAEAARDFQIDLVYLAGEEFERSPQSVLYDLVGKHNVDGVILWNSFVSQSHSLQETQDFVDWFRPLPVVSIDLELAGCANLLADDAMGVRSLLLHLIRAHGYRKIAFVGQDNNHFSILRQEAFERVMSEFELYSPDLVCSLDSLMEVPVGQRNACEAVVAYSDYMAVQVIEAFRERGIRVPEDVVVTGFNDGEEARGSQPALTTVRLPYRMMGRRAVELLVNRLRGEQAPPVSILTPQLIVRRSCGCLEPMAEQAAAGPVVRSTGSLREAVHSARLVLLSRITPSMGTSSERLAGEWAEELLRIIVDELDRYLEDQDSHTSPSRQYLHDLSELLREAVQESNNISRWQEAISLLRQYLLPYLKGSDLAFVEDMWQQARVLVGQVAVRAEVHRGWQAAKRTEILREIESDLLITVDHNELLDILAEGLPRLGVRDFYLVLYENEDFNPESRGRLEMVYQNGRRVHLDPYEKFFPVSEILPQRWLSGSSPFSIVVEALHLRAEQIGYIVFHTDPPLDPAECDVFQALRIQLSSAIKGVRLRHTLQDARHQAEEANQLKSRFLSMVSHELRTPLNLIVGLSEMALRQQARSKEESQSSGAPGLRDSGEGLKRFLDQIYVSGQHLDRLIRDVLDLASSQVGQMTLITKPLDLAPVLQDVAVMGEHLAQQKNLHFRMDVPDQLPHVMGDKTRLRQILLNLLSNAIKFTAHGEVVLTAVLEDQEILISVRDTGLGIAKEDLEKIFDEFRQSDRSIHRGYGGIGLGLAISRRLVELHGGRIWVTSNGEEGGGSTFQFTLPVLADPQGADAPVSGSENAREGVVLIVTSTVGESQELMEYLDQHGFQVEEMVLQDTHDIMENLQQDPPGAVVLDLAPASEQGWDIMKQVKETPVTQDIPVLFYSLIREEDSGVVLEMDYLTKPVGIDNLVKALNRHGLVKSMQGPKRTVLIVDDEPSILDMHSQLVRSELPDINVLTARNGQEGLHIMRHAIPDLVILDLMMPELDGFGVLKAMQAEQSLRSVPVIVLSGQVLTRREMDRLNQGVAAVLSKGMFNSAEILSRIEDSLARNKRLGSESQKLVQQAMGFIHEHFKEPISRADIASALCINEQYLSRCFNKEMGIGPMVYLSRYRIQRAKRLLELGNHSITQVAMEVGMSSQSYFSRVFQEETGLTPSAYQRGARSP